MARERKPRRRDEDRGRKHSPPRGPASPTRRNRDNTNSSHPPNNGRTESYRPRDYEPQGRTDSYRPPQGDFTFRVDRPDGAQSFPPPPTGPANDRPRERRANNRRGDGRGGRGRGGRGGRRWPPPHLSERALLSNSVTNLPEEQLHESEGAAKFRNVDDLSDDDELAMDISSHSSQSDSEQPSKKRAKTETHEEDADAAPKWSNPDPYTALPCPDETAEKKKDVVALIRKARIEEAASKKPSSQEAEDFIAFDSSDEDDEEEDEEEQIRPENPPEPPKEPPPPLPPGRPPPPASNFQEAPARLPDQRDPTGPLGTRKRTANDEIKPPDYGQLKKVSMKPSKGNVVQAWQPKSGEDSSPWSATDHSHTSNVAFRLHKEVMDFYDYVKPRQFEQRIRDNLIENLRKGMRRDNRNFASAQVFAFGSFMSGLYLPTADMDLVVCSESFMRGGPPTYMSAKSWLYKFQKMLVMQRLADQDSIEVIAHARIPLVKFVDKLTGLKVDVSFENLGGVDAVDTFLRWKQRYPSMPILVTVIKHFLLMRGLNEPVNGGIGGFSVICLVVSMLQLMPQVQSGSLIPEHHLGEMLLEFFDLYGRHFNYEKNAISLTNTIGYVRKVRSSSILRLLMAADICMQTDVRGFAYRNKDRLSIIDPNNSANDISGGSSNTPSILNRFEDAYHALRDRMKQVATSRESAGILEVILSGNYSSFRSQRDYLQHVHEKNIGPCSD